VLAVSKGGVEALEHDVGHCVVREVRWFSGDKIWVGSHVRNRKKERGTHLDQT
jgi:hypothetical protein